MRSFHPLLVVVVLTATPATGAPPTNYDDAPLRAVRFVDKQEGWAVGDHGVIWHTIDGGKTWERQPSGTRASLRAVQFLTPYTGFVVGRTELPHGAGSQGVVLTTADGGATWREVTGTLLPGLNAVQFFDEQKGVVAGDCTDAFPTGVFSTEDGGRTWKPFTGPRGQTWASMDFVDVQTGMLGANGGVCEVRGGSIGKLVLSPHGDGERYLGRSGDRRYAVSSGVNGPCFETAEEALAPPAHANAAHPDSDRQRTYDARCTAVVGSHVWVSGRPGSVVYHSPDAGKTWEAQRTSGPAPIHGIHFVDERTGWAAGELGVIYATTDGGKTWTAPKVGGQRAAVLFAHAAPHSVPLAAVAHLSKEGYRSAAVALTDRDEPRLSAAMRAVGGAAGDFDELFYPGRSAAGHGNSAFVARLVYAIRTWRPEVIVTDLLSAQASPEEQAVLVAMKDAFEQAADPKAFPQLGLPPHAAKKLYAVAPATGEANVALDLTAFVPEFGAATKDYVEPAAALLDAPNPDAVRFRLIAHRLPGAEKHTALMEGIELAEGGTGRRKALLPLANVADAEKATKLRRQLETIVANPAAAGGLESALAQVLGGLAGLPDEMAARTAVVLGKRFADAGQWTAARELFAVVAEKYAAQPPAVEAVRWLVRFYASGEVRRRIELGHLPVFQKAAFAAVEDNPIQQVSHAEAFGVKPAFRFSGPDAAKKWHQAALDLEPKLAAFGAAYARDPANNLSALAARKQLGLNMTATKQLQALLPAGDPIDGWRQRLADELKVLSNQEPAHTPRMESRFTAVRPLLDGKLDDACWKGAPVVAKGLGGYETHARLAWDDKFLYVGVTCRHPEGKQAAKVEKRVRDADLSGHDRVEVLLDLDRDYQSYYRLRVDQRGCVAEDCWGDAAWNPRWFVAVEPTPTGWTAEVAIPFAELAERAPAAGHLWAASVVRVVPGVGVDSTAGPSAAAPTPAAMGLLKFVK